MDRSLRERILQGGAVVNGASALPLHFGDPAAELRAALHRVVLADRSSHARLLGDGPDLLGLLNRLSTAQLRDLAPGQGRPTVLTTSKANAM